MIYFFALFTITITLQIIEYVEILFYMIIYDKKIFKLLKKWLMQIKNVKDFPHFLKFCDTRQKNRIYST